MGDGELQEGQIWEAAMTTPKHKLGNVTAIVDRNRLKAMDAADSAKTADPLVSRWEAFGWTAREVDGHDMRAICGALDWAAAQKDRPAAIVCNTVKGKGISSIENQAAFHNAALAEEQFAKALTEVEEALRKCEVDK